MKLLPIFLLLASFLFAPGLQGQSAEARGEAHRLSVLGLEAMGEGRYNDAIEAFAKSRKLDARNPQYPLQLAHAYFFNNQYDEAMDLVKPMMTRRGVSAEAWQIYGNCLDEQGKSYEALQVYRDGLRRFPDSGLLYLEMGILEYSRHNDDEALRHWEDGIRRSPIFPSNYYFAAKLHLRRGDYVWASVYAEMFLNLDRIGERTREMSVLLLEAYEQARWFDFKEAFKWKFYQVPESLDAARGGFQKYTPEYAIRYDEAYSSELPDTSYVISLKLISELRRFVAFYIAEKYPDHPAAGLMEWHRIIAGEGHLRAYNYWLLYDARPDEFLAWYEKNRTEYEQFEGWFLRNTYHKHLKKIVVRPLPDPQ